jgi:sugar phosphate isomerase/epimerase
MLQLSIASFSFHRALQAGRQDMFQYILDSKALGATQLDPWNAHLAQLAEQDRRIPAPETPNQAALEAAEVAYLRQVRAAADKAGLPFGCLAVDGAHIYEPDPLAARRNRAIAYRWLAAARLLGARQVRIDAGGQGDWSAEVFAAIVAGYNELIAHAGSLGIEILMENHWGPSNVPENVVRIMGAVPGLGLLFDSHNWSPGSQERGWQLCARYARSVHIKTFSFAEHGNDPAVDIPRLIRLLMAAGYSGTWGVESVPVDGDEHGAVARTFALIRRSIEAG